MLVRQFSSLPDLWPPEKRPSHLLEHPAEPGSPLAGGAAGSTTTPPPLLPAAIRSRTRRFIAAHAHRLPALEASKESDLVVREIESGVTNFNFAVYDRTDPSGGAAVFVKHAQPFLSKVPAKPLFVGRQDYEVRGIAAAGEVVPGVVPRVLLHDEGSAMLVTQFLSGYATLTAQLAARDVDPRVAAACGSALGKLHGERHSSAAARGGPVPGRAGEAAEPPRGSDFVNEEHLVLMDGFILSDLGAVVRDSVTGASMSAADLERADTAAAELRRTYLHKKETLIHADLHSGNVMVEEPGLGGEDDESAPRDVKFLDWEKVCYGPAGFDLGLLWAGYLWYAIARGGPSYLDAVKAMWGSYAEAFRRSVGDSVADAVLPSILADSVGFLGFWAFFMVSPRGVGEAMFPVGFGSEEERARAFRAIEEKGVRAMMASVHEMHTCPCDKAGLEMLSSLFQS